MKDTVAVLSEVRMNEPYSKLLYNSCFRMEINNNVCWVLVRSPLTVLAFKLRRNSMDSNLLLLFSK